LKKNQRKELKNMAFTNAIGFARETGYPLKMLMALLRQGAIPHERNGRRYYFERDAALSAIRERQEGEVRQRQLKEQRAIRPKGGSFAERRARLLSKI
jgi:hypothetical protein